MDGLPALMNTRGSQTYSGNLSSLLSLIIDMLDVINKAMASYGIDPFASWEEVQECAKAGMPAMSEFEEEEAFRRLWMKIAEREDSKYKQTEYQTVPQMTLV
jgi:hypothetical protein